MYRKHFFSLFLFFIAILSMNCTIQAEEGMWTFDNVPLKYIKEKYDFTPSPEWLLRARMASVRFNDGGSGAFISSTGLVITNHHVAVEQLQKMSSEAKDYVKDGFYAKTKEEEIKCTDLELNILVSMENVTERINNAIKNLNGNEALMARKAEKAKIELENLKKTGMRSDVVTLYHGGEYWLYTYKKYRDVRLVMAPEKMIAFYGGDSDNFTYPRYDLDFAIFRVYEDNKPVCPSHYFKYNPKGVNDKELIFVCGHPGTTNRLITFAQYKFLRDFRYPTSLNQLKGTINLLEKYSQKGEEQKRRAQTFLFYLLNSYKAVKGEYDGLKDKVFTQQFQIQENKTRKLIENNPQLKKETGPSWGIIETAYRNYSEKYKDGVYKSLKGYKLPNLALSIVFYVKETKKPDGERLDGFHDSQLDTWKYINLSPAPIYPDMEEVLLAFNMNRSKEKLGANNPFIKILLEGKSPENRAKELVEKTKLIDPAYRKSLIEGGERALNNSDDPLIKLAIRIEPHIREMIKWKEKYVESIATPAQENIARAKFKILGKTMYPDATFTLRITFGTVKGYPMNGTMAPPFTTFYGLYDRYYGFGGKEDWALPKRYIEKKDSLVLSTHCNFVSTADIIGGNSGSPVINRSGEYVGLIFDGNMESLPGCFIYSETANRAVAVDSAAIIEALRKLYDAGSLADEIVKDN